MNLHSFVKIKSDKTLFLWVRLKINRASDGSKS